ncbi:MAG: hypothetical protein V4517_05430 [Pseudomonadota bacterium]
MNKWQKVFERADGKAKLTISERNDGLYCFGVEEEYIRPDDDGTTYTIWVPESGSGLYQTANEAEAAARAEVLWMATAKSN